MVFYLPLNVILSILEFTDPFTKPTHQFRNLFTTKKQKHYKCNKYNMRTTE